MTLEKPNLRHASTAPAKAKRLDIQGLRAVAVLAVVINHLVGWPVGGFVGVDVFFVISGFVITHLLLREYSSEGKISFVGFYKRRVRRIMPASVLVLAATVAASYLLYLPARATGVVIDSLWALLFAANWRFAIGGTDYWAQDTPVSPIQHYWSLGVEEQYYFVWPAIIALVFAFAVKTKFASKVRNLLAVILGALTIASLGWAMFETATSPAFAYFSTSSRAWELGVGALVAVAAPAFARIPSLARTVLSWAGLAGIVASLAVVNTESAFPAPWALLPVLATALVIVAGTGAAPQGLAPLTNRFMTYVGDISYSLYLWHFPVLILLEVLWPQKGTVYYLASIVLMAALSVASYHLVEQTILRSSWLSDGIRVSKKRRSGAPSRQLVKLGGLGVLAAVTAAVCTLALMQNGSAPGGSPVQVPGSQLAQSGADAVADTETAKLQARVQDAVNAAAWPELKPGADVVSAEGKPEEDSQGCGSTDINNPTSCFFPQEGATKTAVVLGDSTGITLLPTIRAALGKDYNIRGITKAGCMVLDLGDKAARPEDLDSCKQWKASALPFVTELKPDLVFITNSSGVMGRFSSPEGDWRLGTEGLLASLKGSGAKLTVVASPPFGPTISECATRVSTPDACEYDLPAGYRQASYATMDATKAHGAAYVDVRPWFCTDNGRCPSFVGDTPVKRDSVHTTKQYALEIVPAFKEATGMATPAPTTQVATAAPLSAK